MELSIMLAKIFAVGFLLAGAGMLLNKKAYMELWAEFAGSRVAMFTMKSIALVVGLILISVHNRWVGDWTLLITLIAWASFLKGAVQLVAPDWDREMIKKINKPGIINLGIVASIVIGLYLGYMAWLA
ncbi:MAG: hypothetical protein ABIA47_00160 [bacterium]